MKNKNLDSAKYGFCDTEGHRYAIEFFAKGSREKDIKDIKNAGFHYDENLNLFIKNIPSPQGKRYIAYCSFLDDNQNRYFFIDGENNKLLNGESFSLIRTFNEDNFALVRKTIHQYGRKIFLHGVIDLSNLKEILPCTYERIYQDEKNKNLLTIQNYNCNSENFDLNSITRTAIQIDNTSKTPKKYNSKRPLKSINNMTQAELIKEHKRINRKIVKYDSIIDFTIALPNSSELGDIPAIFIHLLWGALFTGPIVGSLGALVIDKLCGTKLSFGWVFVGAALPPAVAICRGTYAKIASAYYENKDEKIEKLHEKLCGKSIQAFENEQAQKILTQSEKIM